MKAPFLEKRPILPMLIKLQMFAACAIRTGLLMAVGMTGTVSDAQTALNGVSYAPVSADRKLRVDFSLPQEGTVLPQIDPVVLVDVAAGDTPISKDKVTFTSSEKVSNYRCAVLLLADKNLARRLWHAARETLSQLVAVAETPPFRLELAAISAGNLEVLVPMESKRGAFDQAIQRLTFDGTSPELYLGLKRGIEALSSVTADRKYIILVSSGLSNDQVISQGNVIAAAREANIHLCTIGFPGSSESAENVQKLEPLAEQTGGYAVRADGRDLRLPADTESNLLRFVISGGLVEVDLSGLKAPVNLDFKVHTHSDRTYRFAHTVDNLPTPPAPPPTPIAVSSPTLPPLPSATPVSSSLDVAKTWISSHLVPSVIAGLVVLALLGVFLARLFQKRRKPQVLAAPTVPADQEPASPPPILAWLETLDSEQTRYPITKSAIRIGRKGDNDIVMKNDTVSAHHAEIVKRGSQFVIADLESSNSVLVRGKRVDKAALQDGDIVELGEVRFRFIEQPNLI